MKEDKKKVELENVEFQRGFSVICASDVPSFVFLLIFSLLGWIFVCHLSHSFEAQGVKSMFSFLMSLSFIHNKW